MHIFTRIPDEVIVCHHSLHLIMSEMEDEELESYVPLRRIVASVFTKDYIRVKDTCPDPFTCSTRIRRLFGVYLDIIT